MKFRFGILQAFLTSLCFGSNLVVMDISLPVVSTYELSAYSNWIFWEEEINSMIEFVNEVNYFSLDSWELNLSLLLDT